MTDTSFKIFIAAYLVVSGFFAGSAYTYTYRVVVPQHECTERHNVARCVLAPEVATP